MYDSSGVESLVAAAVAAAAVAAAVNLFARVEWWSAVAAAVHLFARLQLNGPFAGQNMMGLLEADASYDGSWSDAVAEKAQCAALHNFDDAAPLSQAYSHLENVGEGVASSFPVACPVSSMALWAMCYEADIEYL